MFAYGVDDGADGCEPVDLVTGPGNIYVAAAKRLLKGVIGIDAEAGPTEIAILADDSADADARRRRPGQPGRARPARRRGAGHRLAELADAVEEALARAGRRHQARRAGRPRPWPAPVGASSSSTTSTPGSTWSTPTPPSTWRSRPATPRRSPPGCATPARSSSAPGRRSRLGDYRAGSNHVLPTGGCACHSSGLSVQSFLRGIHVVDYSADALREVAAHVVTLAHAEDLPAHGEAVLARHPEVDPAS